MRAWHAILGLHIAVGTVGLLILGPVAMWAAKPTQWTGEAYHCVMLAVCVIACAMAVLDWKRIWWFLPIIADSYAFALLGYLAAKRRWRGWLVAHVSGQGGSYIAMLTAVLVVNWHTLTGTPGVHAPWAWILPTPIGSPIISWVNFQIRRGRLPR
jgi:hypothetical protein